jgi:hypothetical protein
MVVLERNGGDIQATAHQTGIPDRTLRAWRGSILPYLPPPPPDSRQKVAELPAFDNDLDTLAFIRQNILGELSRLSASLQYDSGFSTPYQRALVLSQLMDKLLKLDVHLKPYVPREKQTIRIAGDPEWMYDDDEEVEIINYERAYPLPERDENGKVWLFPGEERLDELDRQRAANPDYDDDDYPA